jgi:hypothetical protein
MISGLQYHLTDLYEFTEYTFWLSAFSANGEGILSEEVTARLAFAFIIHLTWKETTQYLVV